MRHRVDQAVDHPRARGASSAYSPRTGKDLEGIAAGETGDVVGEQPGGIDDRLRCDPFMRRHHDQVVGGRRLDADHRRADEDGAVAARDLRLERAHVGLGSIQPVSGDHSADAAATCGSRLATNARSTGSTTAPLDAAAAAIRSSAASSPLWRDDQFAATDVRHAVLRAEGVEAIAPLDAQPLFQRA
jgi:hypothetical protein